MSINVNTKSGGTIEHINLKYSWDKFLWQIQPTPNLAPHGMCIHLGGFFNGSTNKVVGWAGKDASCWIPNESDIYEDRNDKNT